MDDVWADPAPAVIKVDVWLTAAITSALRLVDCFASLVSGTEAAGGKLVKKL